ncbi:MAG: hypothetical protein AAGI66_05190 [Cyanobacteria bacterium P01_H01_bin.74]
MNKSNFMPEKNFGLKHSKNRSIPAGLIIQPQSNAYQLFTHSAVLQII